MIQDQEIINLASEGYFYDKKHPFSSGKAYINVLTAKTEDILCKNNFKKQDILYEIFMKEILVDKTVDPNEILQCDVETILLNLKIISQGSSAKFNYDCSNCLTKNEQELSFLFKPKHFDFSKLKNNTLEYKLPKSEFLIKYRLPTYRENLIYEKRGWIEFIKNQTIEVEGISDISNFYENELSVSDSKHFREHFFTNSPGFNTEYDVKCKGCNSEIRHKIDVDCSIFGLSAENKQIIHEEIFFLCYGSNGGFHQSDVYNMPSSLRKFYLNKLIETKKSENEAVKKQSNSSRSGNQPSRPNIQRPPIKR